MAIVIYRLGTHIPIPGIDPARLAALFDQNQGTILEMFNLFSGGALERMSIFALNVVPYISAQDYHAAIFKFNPISTRAKKRWSSWTKSNYSIHKIWNGCACICSSISSSSNTWGKWLSI